MRIGNGAFINCCGFNESLNFYNLETRIGSYAFCNCSGFKGSLVIPAFIDAIEDYTFCNCTGFSGLLSLPTKIKKIGEYAFSNCSGFKHSLYIPKDTIEIDSYAFLGCSGFNGILTLTRSLLKIGENAFLSTNFLKIIYNGKNEPLCNHSIGFSNDENIWVKNYYQNNSFCFCQIQYTNKSNFKPLQINQNNNLSVYNYHDLDLNKENISEKNDDMSKSAINESIINSEYISNKLNQDTKVMPKKDDAVLLKPNNSQYYNINITKIPNDNKTTKRYMNQIKIIFLISPIAFIILHAFKNNFYASTAKKTENKMKNLGEKNEIINPHSYNHIDVETIENLKSKGCQKIGVHSVYIVSDYPRYVVKEMENIKNFKEFFGEYDFLVLLNHINIIKAYGISFGDKYHPPCIWLEHCPFDLSQLINELKKEEKISIIYEICIAMSYVHKKKVIHRDLKPSNILINEKKHVKLCDFGISKLIDNDTNTFTHQIGTLRFMAPEIKDEKDDDEPYGYEVDVYSFGIIVFMILSNGHYPDKANNKIEKYKINKISKELIEKCCSASPNERPTFDEIIDYIKNNNFKLIDGININLIISHLQEIYDVI